MTLIARLAEHARQQPARTALSGGGRHLDYAALHREVGDLADRLREREVRVLGLFLDNGPDWALLDLAALAAGITVVPLPPFFSAAQLRNVLRKARVQAVLTDQPDVLAALGGNQLTARAPWSLGSHALTWFATVNYDPAVPGGVAKLTFTSGTTGDPKGVMLGWSHIEPVVRSLADAVGVRPDDRHLALNPLAVLLENIGNLYVPLWAGATAILPGIAETGLRGASGVDAPRMARVLAVHRATATVFMPQTLLGVVEQIERGATRLPDLRFAAVGGAPVSPRLLARADLAGMAVFEGYGMSECASVMTLNTPAAHRPGSVGRPLPHVRLRIVADGEVEVAGPPFGGGTFAGYLGDPPADPEAGGGWWRTGDLGRFDADGFLYLTGRRRNGFITAFGRNVAPEWVERELTLETAIAQAAVFGEARPFNAAVLVPAADATPEAVAAAVARANAALPDYARVAHWIPAEAPFTSANGLFTGTGRVRREAVYAHYRGAIESLYREETPA